MANKTLFKSAGGSASVPVADTVNDAGGKAYEFTPKHALAQIAATNTFNGTYYSSAETNLKLAQDAASKLHGDPKFIAQVALFSRDRGYMKDMPAFLCAVLAELDTELFRKVFRSVVNNGKMLRNVVQIARSGQAGRVRNMSSGTYYNAIREWFNTKSPEAIFQASIGNDPSMRDILRMVRPKPNSKEKAALFGYLVGKEYKADDLPEIVRQYENYKVDKSGEVPKVDFRFLDSLGLDEAGWKEVARNARWTMTRMNLNTFARHNVFSDKNLTQEIAARLKNREEILQAKAFPYQLLMAYLATGADIPFEVRDALQDAMEVAVENTPELPGQIYVAVDTSGSMSQSVTGYRPGATSKVSCVQVAALFASTILRKNRSAVVIPFDTRVHDASSINSRDTVMTNATKLAAFGGGGTNFAAAIEHLNSINAKGEAIIFVSDNESWVDSYGASYYGSRGTGMMAAWQKFKQRNPKAKLICIDLTPRDNSQAKEHKDILQVGGFSDQVFEVVNSFLRGGNDLDHWVKEIEAIEI